LNDTRRQKKAQQIKAGLLAAAEARKAVLSLNYFSRDRKAESWTALD